MLALGLLTAFSRIFKEEGNAPLNEIITSAAFAPNPTSIGGSAILSALVGILPLIAFFVLLGVFKLKTHWCALGSLAIAAVSAALGFGMPAGMVFSSALYGIAFGLLPIIFIVIAAVWLYNISVGSGRAEDVRTVFSAVGRGDMRVQALLIGFSFCGLLEGLAGFGAPVAIVAAMLVSLGLPPIKAAIVTMVGNAINVGFGAMAIPVTTAGKLGGLAGADPGTAVAFKAVSITPWIVVLVPIFLLLIIDGVRGLKQLWHVALFQGVVTAIGHIVAATFISYALTAVLASLVGFAAAAAMIALKQPEIPEEFHTSSKDAGTLPSRQRITLALLPYGLVVIIFALYKLWKFGIDIPATLAKTDIPIQWPGLYGHLMTADGQVSKSAIYNIQILNSPGFMIVITALIVSAVYAWKSTPQFQFTFVQGLKTFVDTLVSLRWSLVTIALVMSLAYVMNFSGQTAAIGTALATTGAAFAFLSPILGWIGTAVTGSATSSNALFANLQATAAHGIGASPDVFLAANSVGGGIGKIVSPQNLAIASTAIQKPGTEAEILRKAAPWSIGLLVYLCALTYLIANGILPAFTYMVAN